MNTDFSWFLALGTKIKSKKEIKTIFSSTSVSHFDLMFQRFELLHVKKVFTAINFA